MSVLTWVKKCQICVQNKQIDNSQNSLEPISIAERDIGPEDVMPIDLLPELPPSGSTKTSSQQLMYSQDMPLHTQYTVQQLSTQRK